MAGKKIRGITIDIGANTTQFQKEMNALDKTLNSTQRELRDIDKLLKFDPKNTTLLKQKQDLLKSAISDTDEKLKKEKEALEQLKKADKSPEVEKQMRALERQIVDDENKVKKFNKELKETEKASSGVEKAKQRFKSFGKGVGVVAKGVGTVAAAGAAAVTATVTATVAAGKTIGKFAGEAAKAGDEIDKMSQKLGMSRKSYQEWGFVLSQNGADIKSLQGGMKTLAKQITSDSDASANAFKNLGLSMAELRGMDRETQFNTVITALQGMEDSSQRAAIASQLLGRSGTALNPLLNQTAEDTEKLKNKAKELGMVMSDDAVNASVKFQDQLDGLQRTFSTVKDSVASTMLPALTDVMGGLQGLMAGEEQGAKQMELGLLNLFDALGKIAEKAGTIIKPIMSAVGKMLPRLIEGIASTVISYLPQLMKMATNIIQALLNAIRFNY